MAALISGNPNLIQRYRYVCHLHYGFLFLAGCLYLLPGGLRRILTVCEAAFGRIKILLRCRPDNFWGQNELCWLVFA